MSDAQRNAMNNLIDTGVDIAQRWRQRSEDKRNAEEARIAYARALEEAKRTGTMDSQFDGGGLTLSGSVGQVALKAVLLRELAKVCPDHPMVKSVECRSSVATVARMRFYRAGAPHGVALDEFAPTDEQAKLIFKRYKT